MFRTLSRTAVVAVVAFTLVLACVPAAQASPFGPSPEIEAGWLDLALSWLSDLLFGEETLSPQTSGPAFETLISTSTGGSTTLAGMCIDPAGRPRPCPEF